MKFFFKDFCETMQARIVIFGMQVDNDVLYCGTETSLVLILHHILLVFLSFHIWNNEF